MTITITENVIRQRYPNRKVEHQTFDEKVEIKEVDDFEMIDCKFTYDRGENGEDVKVLKLTDCNDIRLTECKFPKKEAHLDGDHSLDVVFLDNSKKVAIRNCHFEGKTNRGNFIDIQTGFDVKIEYCDFKDHSYNGRNGGEAILIGRGRDPDKSFDTHVTDCHFTNCSGDDELISIKQSETEIVHNTFEDWNKGNVSIRFGNRNTIKDNTFKGSGGGIVVRGKDSKILDNNHIRNNNDEREDFRPLTLENGRSDGGYAPAKDNTIKHNTYDNCEGICIILGQEEEREQDKFPTGNRFENNIVIATDVQSSFLTVPRYRGNEERRREIINANSYENNELRGPRANPGPLELPTGAVIVISEVR